MTDLLDAPAAEPVTVGTMYQCQKEGCSNALPAYGEDGFHPARKYCDEHQPASKSKKKDAPPRITVNMGTGKTSKKSEVTEQAEKAAAMYLGFLPVIFAMANDEVCSAALADSIPAMAHQIALLTEFHPGLAKMLSPSESVGEAMVWAGLAMAMGPAITAILVHHHLLPEKLAAIAQATFLVGADVAGA